MDRRFWDLGAQVFLLGFEWQLGSFVIFYRRGTGSIVEPLLSVALFAFNSQHCTVPYIERYGDSS